MRHRLAAAAAVLVLAAGCGSDTDPSGDPTSDPAPSPTPSATAAPSSDPTPEARPFTIRPGGFGPVEVGMTKAEAAATGLFDVDVTFGVEGCRPVVPLLWKAPYDTMIDVVTDPEGTITSLGVLNAAQVRTDAGTGVGSTLAQIRAAHPGVSAPESTGFDQTGVWIQSGQAWLGFLFDVSVGDLTDTSTVTFMEAATGDRPPLIRSGC